ncbi:MAG: CopG family transcriptional regulator [Asgard group archaeon]|nr:CopG family transcriptional regulator [Asgard group archaeon]
MYEEAKMEKLTINIPPVDIGRVDILVEAGFYPSRTEFIRSAIRKTLDTHQKFIDSKIDSDKSEYEAERKNGKWSVSNFVIGVMGLNKNSLERALAEGKKVRIHVIGMLNIKKDVTADLIMKSVESAKIYGVLRASPEVKKAFEKIKSKKS